MATQKRQIEKSMMPQLPHDIITDILLRLPAKSLLRFRSVVKAWNSLITSEQFVGMHLNHAIHDTYNNRHTVIHSSDEALQFLHYEASNLKVVRSDLPLKHPKGFQVLGSCNGLLCILIHYDTIVLWNPSTREYKKIPLQTVQPYENFGFGYDFAINDYKVVRFSSRISNATTAEVYTLKMNSWRKIQSITCPHLVPRAVHVNGALYWVVPYRALLLRFDLMDEKFMLVPPPAKGDISFRMGVFGGCLCIIFRPDVEWETESLWALKEDGTNFSWSELMTIPPLDGSWPRMHYCIPICFRNNGDVLMQIERDWMFEYEDVWLKKFYLYNPVKRIFKRCVAKDVWRYEDEDNVSTEKFYLYNPIKETFKRCLAKDVWMYEDEDVWNEEATHIESLVSPNGVGRER